MKKYNPEEWWNDIIEELKYEKRTGTPSIIITEFVIRAVCIGLVVALLGVILLNL